MLSVSLIRVLGTSQDPACQQVYASLLNDGPPADQSQRTHGPTILNNTLMSLAGVVGILAPAGYKNSDADLRPGRRSKPGVGYLPGMHGQPAKGTKLITDLVKTEIDMERHLQRLHLREQGRASHLTETQTQLEELSWSRIVRQQSVPQTAFMLQARANVLMDGPRIARAYGILQPSCPLCGQQPWTVKHVLANCKLAR